MIKKLKTRFILLCMISLFALLAIIVVSMNVVNYNSVVRECDEILSLLSRNKGMFPEMGGLKEPPLPNHMSPELPYESRYFSVLLDGNGDVITTETSRIISVDTSDAIAYAQDIIQSESESGFVHSFRYVCIEEMGGTRITFLDCGRMLNSFYNFLSISCIIALVGFVIVFLVIFFLSERIIRPIAESYEKQKRFITDAGHEIKTPLTIINANVDVLEMELGDNECLEDIQAQTQRLTNLTNDLVRLARMEENDTLQMIDFPISDVISESVTEFKAPADLQNKTLDAQITPMLTMCGDAKAIRQLTTLLLDNALKYSPADSTISVQLTQENKHLIFSVGNQTVTPFEKEHINRVFDRFYRMDSSRNSETGGHGIGLSIAKAIVEAHDGKIQAHLEKEDVFRITATFSSPSV